jgi:hypothetical protein
MVMMINNRPWHAVGPSKSNALDPTVRPSARQGTITVDRYLSLEKASTPSLKAKHSEPIYPGA